MNEINYCYDLKTLKNIFGNEGIYWKKYVLIFAFGDEKFYGKIS